MQELSRRTRARLLTDIAFATALAAAASFSIAAQAQTSAPQQQDDPARRLPGEIPKEAPEELRAPDKPDKEPSTTGETRAAPEPRLPADQLRPPVSGKPLDDPDKALHPAPPEKVEEK